MRLQKSCAPGESYEDEGSGPMVLDTALFFFFFPEYILGAKRSFAFWVISFKKTTSLHIPCPLQFHARKTARPEKRLPYSEAEKGAYVNLHLQTV